jgi:hypothetical protein
VLTLKHNFDILISVYASSHLYQSKTFILRADERMAHIRLSGIKNNIVTLFMVSYVLFLCGCAAQGTSVSRMKTLTINDFSRVSKALQADMPDCTHLRDIRFHTSFSTDLGYYEFLETRDVPNTRWMNVTIDAEDYYPYFNGFFKTVYGGDIAQDFTAVVNHVLTEQCGVIIVETPEQADVAVSGVIKKFHSQLIDKIDDFKDGWSVHSRSINMKIASIAYVESKINTEQFTYEELLSIDHHKWYKVDKSKHSVLLGGKAEEEQGTDIKTYLHNEFLLSQYSQASALRKAEFIMLHSTSSDMKNTFRIYNDDDGVLIKSFKNIDHNNRRTSDYGLFNQYRKLYTTGFGNLLYLANDYTKQLIERVSNESH